MEEPVDAFSGLRPAKPTNLWKDLGELMAPDSKAVRKDTLEGVELSLQARKALEDKKKNAKEFECLDGDDGRFTFASSSITVIETKKKKKRR